MIFISAGCLASAQPRGPECRRSTSVLPQQKKKNKITSFPLSVGGLLSLMLADPTLMPSGLLGYFRGLILPRSSKRGMWQGWPIALCVVLHRKLEHSSEEESLEQAI